MDFREKLFLSASVFQITEVKEGTSLYHAILNNTYLISLWKLNEGSERNN